MAESRKLVSFRFNKQTDDQLNDIATAMHMTRNDVVINLISAESDRIKGNPQLMKLIEQMNDLKTQIEQYGK